MSEKTWRKDPKGIHESYWLDLTGSHVDKYHPEDHWLRAAVKRDGCIHLYVAFNEPFGPDRKENNDNNMEYLHICDIDSFIAHLMALRDEAKAYYGEDWPR